MKKIMVVYALAFFIVGCCPYNKPKDAVVIKINDYEMTRGEFEQEFKDSSFGREDTPQSRKEFLDNLINRKLILQNAQAKGIDKNKDFLKVIERFWEQSLLKLAVDQESKEIASATTVGDKEIEEAYQQLAKEGKTDKSYEQMYQQVKWQIKKLKGEQKMNVWLSLLRKNADIQINTDLVSQGR